jgi:hypothetical protein
MMMVLDMANVLSETNRTRRQVDVDRHTELDQDPKFVVLPPEIAFSVSNSVTWTRAPLELLLFCTLTICLDSAMLARRPNSNTIYLVQVTSSHDVESQL